MKLTTNNIWFTSDTHYMHKNICRGVTNWDISTQRGLDAVRDFETLEEMNDALVNNINTYVQPSDWLIHNGDWSFGGFEMIPEFRSKINCKNIVLMLGNHDHHILNNKGNVRKLFSHIAHYEELTITRSEKSSSEKFVLCHYPIISWNNLRKGALMIHGHQHLKGDNRFGAGRRMDVGICGSPEFRPYHIDEILAALDGRRIVDPDEAQSD
jgi:calcineurin-like phosphoesterase family protein